MIYQTPLEMIIKKHTAYIRHEKNLISVMQQLVGLKIIKSGHKYTNKHKQVLKKKKKSL